MKSNRNTSAVEQVKCTDLLQPRSHRRGYRRGSRWGLPHGADGRAGEEETSSGRMLQTQSGSGLVIGSSSCLCLEAGKEVGWEELVSRCGAAGPGESLLPVGLRRGLVLPCHRVIV